MSDSNLAERIRKAILIVAKAGLATPDDEIVFNALVDAYAAIGRKEPAFRSAPIQFPESPATVGPWQPPYEITCGSVSSIHSQDQEPALTRI